MRSRRHRPGTIYLMVMATVVVVVTLALTGLALVRVQRRQMQESADMLDARSGAMNAMSYGASAINLLANWRSTAAGAGGLLFDTPLGRGTITATITDPVDGDLVDSDDEAVELMGTGTAGASVQMYKVQLAPLYYPMTCLGVAIAAGDDSKVDKGVIVGSGKLANNKKIDSSNARVYLPVECPDIRGSTYYAAQNSAQPARQIPDQNALAWYAANGTQITAASVAARTMQNIVLSPGNNPYGTRVTNPRGIYWIDCGPGAFTISNVRIVGTLVLLNVGDVTISGSINWEPASAGLPALLVDGKVRFDTKMSPLVESTVGANFNPASTPYKGASNASNADSYPSRIKGLVFTTKDLEIRQELMIEGVLVCAAKLDVKGILGITFDNTYYYSPPPGFRASGSMVVVPGTFAQVVN